MVTEIFLNKSSQHQSSSTIIEKKTLNRIHVMSFKNNLVQT